MKRALAAALALALLALGAWYLARRPPGQSAAAVELGATERTERARPDAVFQEAPARAAADAAPSADEQERTPSGFTGTLAAEPEQLLFFGRVVRDEDGAPVASAQVVAEQVRWSTEPHPQPSRSLAVAADGSFEFSAPQAGAWIARATAMGFAPASFPILPGHGTPDTALVVHLERPAFLAVRVVDLARQPLPDIQVSVSIRGVGAAHAELWYDAVSIPDFHQERMTDSDGRARFEALTPRTIMHIEASRDDRVLLRRDVHDIVAPGETRELELVVGAPSALRGIVIDQDGRPVADLALWILQDLGYGYSSFENTVKVPTAQTRTGADGRFRFEGLAYGGWHLGPAPAPENVLDVAPVPERVVHAAEDAEHEITLHVWRGLFVRGRVVQSSDEPAGNANVHGRSSDNQRFVWGRAKADGSFALGPLVGGEYDLTAGGMNNPEYAPSSVQRVATGTSGVVLVVEPAASIFGRVEDEHGEPQDAELMLSTLEPSPAGGFPYGLGTTEGGFQVQGLAAGRYDLVAKLRGPRIAFARFTLATGEHRNLVLRAEPAATLVVRNTATSNDGFFWFELRIDGVLIHASGLEAGRFERCVVPAGTITVEFLDPMRKPLETVTVELASGEEKKVERAEAGD